MLKTDASVFSSECRQGAWGMAGKFPSTRRRFCGGFTLIELLLVVLLISLLMGALVIRLTQLPDDQHFKEASARFESLLRYARAEAARSGRKVKLEFASAQLEDSRTESIRLLWEPSPWKEPNTFYPLPHLSGMLRKINEGLRIISVEVLTYTQINPMANVPSAGAEPREQLPAEPENSEPAILPIVFYPDGSSDSVEVKLAPRDPGKTGTAVIRLVGLTGSITRHAASPGPVETTGMEATAIDAKDALKTPLEP